jgi:hypothetical protein
LVLPKGKSLAKNKGLAQRKKEDFVQNQCLA